MKIEDLKIGDIVDIIYLTYTNNGGKRNLKNLRVDEIQNTGSIFDRIIFTQLSSKKCFHICKTDVTIVYRRKTA